MQQIQAIDMSHSNQVIEIKNHLRRDLLSDVSSIIVIEQSMHMCITIAIEYVSAGFPSPAQDYIDKKIDMNEHLIQNECATFIVKVASLSMINAGIDIDDELIVDRSLDAKHDYKLSTVSAQPAIVSANAARSQFVPVVK